MRCMLTFAPLLKLLICAGGDSYRVDEDREDFCQAVAYAQECNWCTNSVHQVLYIAARWKPCGLDLYDTEAWSRPEVDASASEEKFAGGYSIFNAFHSPMHERNVLRAESIQVL